VVVAIGLVISIALFGLIRRAFRKLFRRNTTASAAA
jgi:hypothetical protein